MNEGDAVWWETINGTRTGTVLGPATIPNYYHVRTQDGKGAVAHRSSLHKIENKNN